MRFNEICRPDSDAIVPRDHLGVFATKGGAWVDSRFCAEALKIDQDVLDSVIRMVEYSGFSDEFIGRNFIREYSMYDGHMWLHYLIARDGFVVLCRYLTAHGYACKTLEKKYLRALTRAETELKRIKDKELLLAVAPKS